MEKKKVRLTDYSDQILGGPGSRYTIFGPQIASPWLLHRTTGATGCFTSSHSRWCPLSRVTGTMTRYSSYSSPCISAARPRCLLDSSEKGAVVYKLRDLGLIPERYWRACSVISMEGRVFPQAIMFHLTSN